LETSLSEYGMRRLDQDESSDWIRLAMCAGRSESDYIFQLLHEHGAAAQYRFRPVTLADAYFQRIRPSTEEPEPWNTATFMHNKTHTARPVGSIGLPSPARASSIISATVAKDLRIARRYLPDLVSRIIDLGIRVGFFLLLSNIITVSPAGSPLGHALSGRELLIFFQGALILLIFNSTSLSAPVQSVYRDMYNGTLEYLYSLPSSRYPYFIGTILANATINLIVFLPVFVLLIVYAQSSALDTLAMLLVCLLVLTTSVALGVVIALLAILWRQIGSLTAVLSVLFEFLSGAYFPVLMLPGFLKFVAMLLPYTWGYDLIRYYSFGGRWQTLCPVPLEWAVLGAFGCAFTTASQFLLKKVEQQAKKVGLHLI